MKCWVQQRYAYGFSLEKNKGPFGSENPGLIRHCLFQHQGQCCTEVQIITLNLFLCFWVGWFISSVGNLNLCGLGFGLFLGDRNLHFESALENRQWSCPLNVFYVFECLSLPGEREINFVMSDETWNISLPFHNRCCVKSRHALVQFRHHPPSLLLKVAWIWPPQLQSVNNVSALQYLFWCCSPFYQFQSGMVLSFLGFIIRPPVLSDVLSLSFYPRPNGSLWSARDWQENLIIASESLIATFQPVSFHSEPQTCQLHRTGPVSCTLTGMLRRHHLLFHHFKNEWIACWSPKKTQIIAIQHFQFSCCGTIFTSNFMQMWVWK